MYIIGIDPGPVVGVSLLLINRDRHYLAGRSALQTTSDLLTAVLTGLARHAPAPMVVAVELFIVGSRASRSATGTAGETAREVVALVKDWADHNTVMWWSRSAAEVKPWATDARLERAGLLEPTAGMRHARDAARHALFCAVRNYGLPDPLSQRGRST